VDRYKGNPGVQLLRKVNQVFRLGKQGLNQDPEKTNKDGELHHQRPEAADGAYPGFPVELHCFLGNPGTVSAVALLDLFHAGLKFAHPSHLANLLQRQGQGYQPNKDGKRYDRQPHVVEADHVKHHQGVQHGANDYFVPEYEEKIKKFQRDS